MRFYYRFQHGVTLIEVLLSLALVGIVATLSAPFLLSFISNNEYYTTRTQMSAALVRAQRLSMSGAESSQWGVCVLDGEIVVFKTSCTTDQVFERYNLPSSIQVSAFEPIVFSNRGEPSSPQSISISSNSQVTQIDVNLAGGIEVQ